jgi:hypothetical protein
MTHVILEHLSATRTERGNLLTPCKTMFDNDDRSILFRILVVYRCKIQSPTINVSTQSLLFVIARTKCRRLEALCIAWYRLSAESTHVCKFAACRLYVTLFVFEKSPVTQYMVWKCPLDDIEISEMGKQPVEVEASHLNNHHGGRKSENRAGHLSAIRVRRETCSTSVDSEFSDLRTGTETGEGGKCTVGV